MDKAWEIVQHDVTQPWPVEDESMQTIVTSPPYWGLRDYGTARWEGGKAECDHIEMAIGMSDKNTLGPDGYLPPTNAANVGRLRRYRDACAKCGARRIDQQLGLERTPEEYVARLVRVFREARRVLRKDGTVWLVIGDSYSGSGKGGNPDAGKQATNRGSQSIGVLYGKTDDTARQAAVTNVGRRLCAEQGFPPKQLIGIPWRVAFALQADGWWLRSDVIWSKPNPMPESVTDRPTKAHEYVFLLSKSASYYYDAEAIAEPTVGPDHANNFVRPERLKHQNGSETPYESSGTRNKRSVWTIATEPYPEAHFATYPTALVDVCIRAGSKRGDLVLDPFSGNGTTVMVALRLGRRAVGLELSPKYVEMGKQRVINDAPLLNG